MNHNHKLYPFVLAFLLLNFMVQAQTLAKETRHRAEHLSASKNAEKNLLALPSSGDSLDGFNENALKARLAANGVYGKEFTSYLDEQKRAFISEKYHLFAAAKFIKTNQPVYPLIANTPTLALNRVIGGGNNISTFACNNEDFESSTAGAYTSSLGVSGWTVTSMTANGCTYGPWIAGSNEFSVISTPVLSSPNLANVGNSPLGGTKIVQLNDFSPSTKLTKIAKTITVTASNTQFQYAFTGYYENGHSCCDNPGFFTQVLDANNQAINCLSSNFNICTLLMTYSNGAVPWQVVTLDLSPYIGSTITFECWSHDCSYGGHYGYTLFDARCGAQNTLPGFNVLGNGFSPVSFCVGSGVAQLYAPQGYASYNWTAPSGSPTLSVGQSTASSITISNPVPFSVYTVNLVTASGCTFVSTPTLISTQVTVSAVNSLPSCTAGSIGSATIQGSGSSVGYNYSWTSPSNSVISTASVASNLSPGVYTVSISAPNYSTCGMATATVAILPGNQPPAAVLKPFCNGIAYLSASGGSNLQWYANSTPVTGTPGTLPSYSVSNPGNNSIYRLGRTIQGCRDSVIYTLISATAAIPGINTSSTGCNGLSVGVAVINATAVANAPSPVFSYSLVSNGAVGPTYSYTSANNPLSSLTATGLPVGAGYSVTVFDGSCYSSSNFTLNPITPAFSFSITPSGTTVCSGNSVNGGITFNSSVNANNYLYSWSPTTFIATNSSSLANPVITPTTSQGNSGSIVYTVVVTPIAANCPVTNTVLLNYLNPAQPIISPINPLCTNSGSVLLNASPSGGTFQAAGLGGNNPVAGGVLKPWLANVGINSFTYTINTNGCTTSTTVAYTINAAPVLTVTNNNTICEGGQSVLNVTGASSYLWSTGQTNPIITVSPLVSTTYSVTGSTQANCSSIAYVTVSVIPGPNLQVTGNFSVCAGTSCTVTASGASSYTWSNSSLQPTQVFTPSTTVNYIVNGKDSLSGCVSQKIVTLVVDACTGLFNNGTLTTTTSIYPNPGYGLYTLESNAPFNFTLYNELGQLIFESPVKGTTHVLDISSYSDGIYFVKCQSEAGVSVSRVVKTNK